MINGYLGIEAEWSDFDGWIKQVREYTRRKKSVYRSKASALKEWEKSDKLLRASRFVVGMHRRMVQKKFC